jgi:apolipoprotein N-acyltransferase
MLLPIVITVLSAGLGYANPILHFPVAVLLFPIVLSYLGMRAETPGRAFKQGWICGSLACLVCMYWIAVPIGLYGGISWLIAFPCPVLVSMFVGLYYGLFSWAMYLACRKMSPLILCIFSGIFWAAMETAQGVLFTGFPWMNLSSAFSFWPETIQGAAYIGAYGLSGVMVILSTSLLFIKSSKSSVAIFLICLAALSSATYQRIFSSTAKNRVQNATEAVVGVVQGNIDQSKKWDESYQEGTLEKYIRLSEKIQNKVDVIIWPETAMPFFIQDPGKLRFKLFQFARKIKTPVLTGAPGYIMHPDQRNYSLYNRAYFIDTRHQIVDWYDKHHLVPFGEYVPLKDYLPIGKLVEGAGDFIPGNECAPILTDRLAMGILICYEGIFPELAWKRVEKGANLLVNISNDAWYGKTSAPYQHLSLVVLRAVEQGRTLIRGTNTGISCTIDPQGIISNASELFVEDQFSAKVKLFNEKTFYNFHYEFITLFPPVVTVIIMIWLIAVSRKKRDKTS